MKIEMTLTDFEYMNKNPMIAAAVRWIAWKK